MLLRILMSSVMCLDPSMQENYIIEHIDAKCHVFKVEYARDIYARAYYCQVLFCMHKNYNT